MVDMENKVTAIEYQQSQHRSQFSDEKEVKEEHTRLVTWRGVVMYGICVILSNHLADWTVMLKAGFWETFIAIAIVGSASGCMMLCIAEMTAALPFSGGTYGVVRVTLGSFIGYLVGTGEVLLYICIAVFKMSALGKYVTIMTGYDDKYEPLYWAILYITIAVICMNHRLLFWRSVWVFGVYICVILLLYCTMTRTGAVDFAKYTKDPMVASESDSEHLYSFFEQLPLGNLFFNMYLKVSPLACRESKNPTTDVPLAMYIVYALAIVSAFSVLFCASSIFPGVAVLRRSPGAPMSFGISSMFDIAMEHAMAFTFLAKYATCLVLVFAFTQQMAALSKSGFLWNSRKWGCVPDRADRLVGMLVGCGFGYLLNIMIYYWDVVDARVYVVYGAKMFNSSINIVVFVTYIVFRQKFSNLVKKFRSPLGVGGAVYGLLVYLLLWPCVGALNSMGDHWRPFVLLACFLVLLSLPYVMYYRHNLTFSEEESSVLFVAYVIKANQERRLKRQSGSGGSNVHKTRSLSRSFQSSQSAASARTGSTSSGSLREQALQLTGVEERKEEPERLGTEEDMGEQSLASGRESDNLAYDLEAGGQLGGAAVPALEMQAVAGRAGPIYPGCPTAAPEQEGPLRSSLKDTATAACAARSAYQHPSAAVRFAETAEDQEGEGENAAAQEYDAQAGASAVQVLARELGYGREVLSQINTEFDEFYHTASSSAEEV